MKTIICILGLALATFAACETPQPSTTNPQDSSSINNPAPDTTTMKQDTTIKQ